MFIAGGASAGSGSRGATGGGGGVTTTTATWPSELSGLTAPGGACMLEMLHAAARRTRLRASERGGGGRSFMVQERYADRTRRQRAEHDRGITMGPRVCYASPQ